MDEYPFRAINVGRLLNEKYEVISFYQQLKENNEKVLLAEGLATLQIFPRG
jgi:hypothetical protein